MKEYEESLSKYKAVLDELRDEIMKHDTYSRVRNRYRNARRHIRNSIEDNLAATSQVIEDLINAAEKEGIDVEKARNIWEM